MERQPLIDFLSQLNADAESISLISREFQLKEMLKGDCLVRQGKIANEYMFLQEGFMRSYLYDIEGNEITMNFYCPNEMVFEVASFFQRVPSQENLEAVTDCRGWVLSYEILNKLFHGMPVFRDIGRAILVKGFIAFKLRTLSMINKTAEERYELLLHANPLIFQHVPLKHIASYLGITDTSLSRLRKSFTQK